MVARIENWSVGFQDVYLAPELRRPCLQGAVFGHPWHTDGEFIFTSPITGADPKRGVVQCVSREYLLGQVDPEYERLFPDAQVRLMKKWFTVAV